MGSASGDAQYAKAKKKGSQETTIPDFLRPLINQMTGTAQGALAGLKGASSGDLVANFTPEQIDAQRQGVDIAGGAGGFIPTAQNTFLKAAGGQALGDFLDPSALSALQKAAGGADLSSFLPPETLRALGLPIGGIESNLDNLNQFAGSSGLPQASTDALTASARGDFLFGGQGFDQAVQAAMNAARPQIQSVFGRSGAGGATGGLAEHAIGQSAIDAFASQFGQERQNQLSAADRLAGRSLEDRGQRSDISSFLANLGIGAGTQLGQFGESERNRGLASAGVLGELGDSERNRQLAAAAGLPDIATAGINLLSGIGGQQQGQEQAEIDAPIMAQLRLLSAALGGLPIEELLGKKTKEKQSAFSTSFGVEGGF